MTDAPTQADTPFWRFSLHFYRQPGVSDACIALQDGCGVDVNVLLFLLWLADRGRALSADEVKRLDDMVRDWRSLTVIPLRDVRRKLKGAHTLIEPPQQEAFRTKVKAIELEAERLQQQALYASTQSGPRGRPSAPGAAARGNISAYERIIAARFPQASVDSLLATFDALGHGASASLAATAGQE